MGRTMTKPLCYPVADEYGLHIAILTENGLIRSHTLNFVECKTMAENCIAQMQKLYVKDKCKCD
jgi:hypothetical protein